MKIAMIISLAILGISEAFGESAMRIDKQYEVPFAVETVYSAWVSSDTVIPPATSMDVLPEVGGHYRLIMETPEFNGRNEGTFSRVEPNARVTYTWEWNADGEVTEIDVHFGPSATGTRVILNHTGFTKTESVTSHDSGWDSYMVQFTEYLGNL